MSEPFAGYVTVAAAAPRGMVSLRADLSSAKVKSTLTKAGIPLPEQRRIAGEGLRAAWMSPDEILLICAPGEAGSLAKRLGEALAGQHHLALDVSDMRAGFTLTGTAVREVLAKLTPADTATLPLGEMRRSRLGQVAAAFWFEAEDRAEALCFRSVADYLFPLLCHAARPGSEVG
jgi:sarcosine oxidase, subunit gamma